MEVTRGVLCTIPGSDAIPGGDTIRGGDVIPECSAIAWSEFGMMLIVTLNGLKYDERSLGCGMSDFCEHGVLIAGGLVAMTRTYYAVTVLLPN